MILNYPSGFYKTVLPPTSGTNVIYTISGGRPPRGTLFFLKMDNNLAATTMPQVATEPQGDMSFGTLRSFRPKSVSGERTPIGSILEFSNINNSDGGRIVEQSLELNIDFPRFSSNDSEAANPKLVQAYKLSQDRLLAISNDILGKNVEISNLRGSIGSIESSLEATNAALAVLIGDSQLIDIRSSLLKRIADIDKTILALESEVLSLESIKKTTMNSILSLSRAIS